MSNRAERRAMAKISGKPMTERQRKDRFRHFSSTGQLEGKSKDLRATVCRKIMGRDK